MDRGYNHIHGFDTGPPPPTYTSAPAPSAIPTYFVPQQAQPQPQPIAAQYYYNIPVEKVYTIAAPAPAPVPIPAPAALPSMPVGYTYAFPSEHAKVHIIQGTSPPWQRHLSSTDNEITYQKLWVPTSMKVRDLMAALGANHSNPKKNKLYEVVQTSNGTWSRGLSFTGDQERTKKMICEFGWDKKRTGESGERPVVWVWLARG